MTRLRHHTKAERSVQQSGGLASSLAITMLVMLVVMTGFEVIKDALAPDLLLWESHVITIIFSSVMATIAAFFVLRRHQQLEEQLVAEIAEREQAEQELGHVLAREQAVRGAVEASAERTVRLQSVTAALSEALTPEQVASVIVDLGVPTLGANAGAMAVLANNDREIEVVRAIGFPQELLDALCGFSIDRSTPLADALRTREAIFLESRAALVAAYPQIAVALAPTDDDASANIPLLVEGRALGGLSLSFAGPRSFGLEERVFMLILAQQCAQALDRARLYAAEQRARIAAEVAVRERNALFALISHDLNNPLAVIRGHVQWLYGQIQARGSSEDQAIAQGLARIDSMVTQMTMQLVELQDIAQLQAGQSLDLVRASTDLVALVRQVVEAYQSTTERHRIALEAPHLSIVGHWDGDRLARVIGNLLANAIKYSPTGGPITIRLAREQDAHGAWAILMVRDQGIGIPAADLSHIFEPFRRAGNIARKIRGSGLGLTSARQIVEAHGGTIGVVSSEGEGSTFTVRLPLSPSPQL